MSRPASAVARNHEQRQHAADQEHAGLHHGGRVQVGRHRRGGGHGARQPVVQRPLGALAGGAHEHQQEGGLQRGARPVELPGGVLQQLAPAPVAGVVAQQADAPEQEHAAQAGGEEGLLGQLQRVAVVAVPADQQEAADAGEFPEHQGEQGVVGQHHAEHGGGEETQRGIKAVEVGPGLLGGRAEVAAGVEHDQHADARDQQREEAAQPVGQEGEVEVQIGNPPDDLGACGRNGQRPGCGVRGQVLVDHLARDVVQSGPGV